MPLPLAMLLGGAALGAGGNILEGFGQKAGYQAALDQYAPLMELMSPEGRAQFLQDYAASEEGQLAASQMIENVLKQASATGGLRTGQANVMVGQVMPQLGLQAYQNQLQNLGAVVPQLAQLESGKATAVPGAFANTLGQVGGLGIYGAQGGFKGLV
jgi:hypothetical protein